MDGYRGELPLSLPRVIHGLCAAGFGTVEKRDGVEAAVKVWLVCRGIPMQVCLATALYSILGMNFFIDFDPDNFGDFFISMFTMYASVLKISSSS
jgi:hypothetical protein